MLQAKQDIYIYKISRNRSRVSQPESYKKKEKKTSCLHVLECMHECFVHVRLLSLGPALMRRTWHFYELKEFCQFIWQRIYSFPSLICCYYSLCLFSNPLRHPIEKLICQSFHHSVPPPGHSLSPT